MTMFRHWGELDYYNNLLNETVSKFGICKKVYVVCKYVLRLYSILLCQSILLNSNGFSRVTFCVVSLERLTALPYVLICDFCGHCNTEQPFSDAYT